MAKSNTRRNKSKQQDPTVSESEKHVGPDDGSCPPASPARPGGKLGLIVGQLAMEAGASADELAKATGWQRHTVLGALSRLRSRGFEMQLRDQGWQEDVSADSGGGLTLIFDMPDTNRSEIVNEVNGENERKAGFAVADLATKLAGVSQMPYDGLSTEWRRLYRSQPPRKVSRELLELGVAWKLQERALGGLGPTLKRRLADLSQTMEDRGDLGKARLLKMRPGARLLREWGGRTHEVLVLTDGFEWQGRKWRSLSVIARKITGTQWSGPRFFGLQAKSVHEPVRRIPGRQANA